MAPSSEKNEISNDIEDSITNISETFNKIKLETETSTYNIDDDDDEDNDEKETNTQEESENNLDDCVTIKEKGLIGPEKYNNNRLLPYERATNHRRPHNNNYYYNNNNYNQESPFNNPLMYDDIINILNIDSNVDNIPAPVLDLNLPPLQTNNAQKQLSDFIDTDKKSKQDIWILVNIEDEDKLIKKLRNKIESQRFNHIDLHYIYAIIIRLMKDDGKHLLIDYLSNDNVLSKIALKQNILLMNFLLEIYQNNVLNMNNQMNILHDIIKQQQMDLCDIFEILINYKLSDNQYMFNVNWVDASGETLLMVLMKYIGEDKTKAQNIRYLDLVLSRYPNITYTMNDGQNIFHIAYRYCCDENIIQAIKSHYDITTVNYLMHQMDLNGYIPGDPIYY